MGVSTRTVYAILAAALAGVVILTVGIVLISIAADNEIKLWYGITLCPCADCAATNCPSADPMCTTMNKLYTTNPVTWQSKFLKPSEQCRSNPPLLQRDGTAQVFELKKDLFSMDGLEYKPVVYRTEASATLTFRITDNNGKTLLGGNLKAESIGELQSVPKFEEAALVSEKEEADEDTDELRRNEGAGAQRKLMKGGRGASGGPSRARTGSQGRWGSGARAYRTPYGYSSCCVYRSTVIFVHRDGPRTSRGYYDTDDEQYVDCASENGCAFEVSQDMSRDELGNYSLVTTDDLAWPLKLHVDEFVTSSYTAERAPEAYFSFYTEDPDNGEVASYVLLPLGCVLILAPIALLFF